MVKFYLRTRGLRIDYSFILEQEPTRSMKDYKSDLEKPTCILERTEKEIFLFLTGIPSQRQDHQGTCIRYDLIATANFEFEDDNEKQKLIGLIWLWLNDVKSALYATQEDGKTISSVRLPSVEESKLGELLDNILPKNYLEELLQRIDDGSSGEDDKRELGEKLNNLLQISKQTVSEEIPEYKAWWGGVNNDASCNKWIKLVEKFLTGESYGKALLLNIASPQSLIRLNEENRELGVLLAKEWSQEQPNQIKMESVKVKEFVKKKLSFWENLRRKGRQDWEQYWPFC